MTTSPIPGLPPSWTDRNWIGEDAGGDQWLLKYFPKFGWWAVRIFGGHPDCKGAEGLIIKSHLSPVQPAGIDKEGGE